MVINQFDVEGITVSPNEANSPLIVDSNAVLSRTIAIQGFKAAAGRNGQRFEPGGSVDLKDFSECNPLHIRAKPLYRAPLEDRFGMTIVKPPDHHHNVTR